MKSRPTTGTRNKCQGDQAWRNSTIVLDFRNQKSVEWNVLRLGLLQMLQQPTIATTCYHIFQQLLTHRKCQTTAMFQMFSWISPSSLSSHIKKRWTRNNRTRNRENIRYRTRFTITSLILCQSYSFFYFFLSYLNFKKPWCQFSLFYQLCIQSNLCKKTLASQSWNYIYMAGFSCSVDKSNYLLK